MFSATHRLRREYVATRYTAAGAVLLVGQRSERADRLLRRFGARGAAFVSACNPNGRRAGAAVNQGRHRRLMHWARGAGRPAVRGVGEGGDGRWAPEVSALVFGVTAREAAWIGRMFRQNAVVFAAVGKAARLVPLR